MRKERSLHCITIPRPIIDLFGVIAENSRDMYTRASIARKCFCYGYGLRREYLLAYTRSEEEMSDAERFAFNEMSVSLKRSINLMIASKQQHKKGPLVVHTLPIMVTATEIVVNEIVANGHEKPAQTTVMSDLVTHGAVYLYHEQWNPRDRPHDLQYVAYKNMMNARLESAITILVDTAPGREVPKTVEEYKELEAELNHSLNKQSRGIFEELRQIEMLAYRQELVGVIG